MKATKFGKILRKLRVDRDEVTKDMAKKLNVSVSHLSAVETGKVPPPTSLADKVADLYGVSRLEATALREAADQSRNIFRLHPKTALQKSIAGLLETDIAKITADQAMRIEEILMEKRDD